MNLYEILGIKNNASKAEIRKAFKSLAGKNHPDKGGDTIAFQKIQKAYEILTDNERRKRYDQTGDTGNAKNIDSIVNTQIAGIFMNLIQQGARGNLIDKAKEGVTSQLQSHKFNQEKLKSERDKFESYLGRVKTSNGFNLYDSTINQQLQKLDNAIKESEENQKIGDEILKRLDQYEDTEPTADWSSYTSTGSTTI